MSLRLDDLPTLEGSGRLGRRPSEESAVRDAYSPDLAQSDRGLGRLSLDLGSGLAEALQEQAFPSGQQLAALQGGVGFGGPSYTQYLDCAGYVYGGTCEEACFGFAPHHMDPFYCATCDEQAADPVNNPAYNWHYVGSRGSLQYKDREPDVCKGRDAWKWKVGPCGDCAENAVFRCHDGYKKYPSNTTWDPTICQGLVSCDNRLTPC